MAQNKTANKAKDPEVVIDSAIQKSEGFIQRNGKALLIALGVVVVGVSGYFVVKSLYLEPRQEKATNMMYVAEMQFAGGFFDIALHGDGNNAGFLEVIDRYGSTAAGNLAKHYAGKSHMHLGQFQEAIDRFNQYKPVKGLSAQIINAQNYGMTGDAYVELGNLKEAVKYYEKAVKKSDNVLTAPYYLKKAGMVYERLGELDKALNAYKTVRSSYGSSLEARDIDKYIGRVSQQL